MVQLSHPYVTTGKTIALTTCTFDKPHLFIYHPWFSHFLSMLFPLWVLLVLSVSLNSAIHSHPWWITIHLRSIPNWFLNPLPLNSFIWWLHALLIIFLSDLGYIIGFLRSRSRFWTSLYFRQQSAYSRASNTAYQAEWGMNPNLF